MRVTDAERAFLHELNVVKRDPLGKRIVHFAVSLAPTGEDMKMKVDGAMRYVQKAFEKSPYLKVFALGNKDLFVFYSNLSLAEVVLICNKVEKLFLGDGVLTVRNAYQEFGFFKVLDASKELDKITEAVKGLIGRGGVAPAVGKQPMTVENLALLVEKLGGSDVRDCIVSQPVYRMEEAAKGVEFVEYTLSIEEIERKFLPTTSIASNPWLFHALREHLDRGALKVMVRELQEYGHGSVSVNLGMSTILGKEFQDFLDKISPEIAARIVLEVHKTDLVQHSALLGDLTGMVGARKLRLCVDGIEWRDLDLLGFNVLEPHYLKIIWNNDLLEAPPALMNRFVRSVKQIGGRTQVILSHCDNPKAFPLVRPLGIRLVQGRLADQFFKAGGKE